MSKTNKRVMIRATMSDIMDGTSGGCLACGQIMVGCEPDMRRGLCECCGKQQVYGLEELLMMERIDLIDDGD